VSIVNRLRLWLPRPDQDRSLIHDEIAEAIDEIERLRAALRQARCHEDCGGQGELLDDSMCVVGVPGGGLMGYEECLRCSLLGSTAEARD